MAKQLKKPRRRYSLNIVKEYFGLKGKRLIAMTFHVPVGWDIEEQPERIKRHIKILLERGYNFQIYIDNMREIKIENANNLFEFIKSYEDQFRKTLMNHLKENEGSTVSSIVEALKEGQSKVSRHLGILRRSNLVKTKRRGQYIHYYLDTDRVGDVLKMIELAAKR